MEDLRRKNDDFMMGFIKGAAIFSGVLVLIHLAFGTWIVTSTLDLQYRVTSIENSRYTRERGEKAESKIVDNEKNIAVIQKNIENNFKRFEQDLYEIKKLLKRSVPINRGDSDE